MEKNKYLSKRIIWSLTLLVFLGIITLLLFDLSAIKYYLLATCGICVAVIGLLFMYMQKSVLPHIIDLTSLRDRILQRIIGITVVLGSAFVIPVTYFILSAILMILTMLILILWQKILVIDYRGIRYACHWNLKWDDVNGYKLDKENGVLEFNLKNGTYKQITGVTPKSYSIIETSIDDFLK
jgi:hypothetical protein